MKNYEYLNPIILPYSENYLLERTTLMRWSIFGELDGLCDISDENGDLFTRIPKEVAERIVKARNIFIDSVLEENSLLSKNMVR